MSSVMSQYEGAKTRVKVDHEVEFEGKVGMHHRSELSLKVVDVVTEFAREGALSEILHADNLVLMIETINGLRNKFLKWMESFESKG